MKPKQKNTFWRTLKERRVLTFDEIAKIISRSEGKRIGRQRVHIVHERALEKLKKALAEDPVIRDWLIDNNMRGETDAA